MSTSTLQLAAHKMSPAILDIKSSPCINAQQVADLVAANWDAEFGNRPVSALFQGANLTMIMPEFWAEYTPKEAAKKSGMPGARMGVFVCSDPGVITVLVFFGLIGIPHAEMAGQAFITVDKKGTLTNLEIMAGPHGGMALEGAVTAISVIMKLRLQGN